MNIDKLCEQNGISTDFESKYQFICRKIGLDRIKKFLPREMWELKLAYKKDEHFNNIPIKEWNIASHWVVRILVDELGITFLSLAEQVCIMKMAARMLINGEEKDD